MDDKQIDRANGRLAALLGHPRKTKQTKTWYYGYDSILRDRRGSYKEHEGVKAAEEATRELG